MEHRTLFAYDASKFLVVCIGQFYFMIAPDIHNSTAEERRNYVLSQWECQNNCEACGRCKILKSLDAETLYADYIAGKRSYIEITLEHRQKY